MIQCVSPSYSTNTPHTADQHAVGVNKDPWFAIADAETERFSNADNTFLEHGDAQILFTLRLSAAHDRLGLALLRAAVTHCQDLDLTVILLGSQAIDRCRATIPREQTPSQHSSTTVQQAASHVNTR